MISKTILPCLLLAASPVFAAQEAGEVGGPGLALHAKKVLTAEFDGRAVVNNGTVLVKDGRIEAVGATRDVQVPAGYEELDLGDRWLAPGMIDLHSHVGGTFDINDMVWLTNPGIRASTAVIPANPSLKRAVAGGVTSILFIPGSGTNIGGQGVLVRTGPDKYEEAEIRNPGSMKLAQAGNPERYGVYGGIGRSYMNWNTRGTFRRGVAYAKRIDGNDSDESPKRDLQFEVFRDLVAGKTQVSTHTQIFQVVLMTLNMVHDEFDIPVYIDHGTFDGWRAAAEAEKRGVFAIIGPRQIDTPAPAYVRWSGSNPERVQGCAAGYQAAGHTRVGFNTDSPVVPQEELMVQAAMGVRYGFDSSNMDHVRGITIVPAMASGIGDQVGSIEVGKFADLLVVTGDPADPRCSVEMVLQSGKKVYDTEVDTRRW